MSHKISTKAGLEDFFCHHWDEINQWLDQRQSQLPQPLTSSVDVRESDYKFAPVDHNMYPAGFNNLCSKDLLHCSDRFKEAFHLFGPVKVVGLIPESHTKNKFYLDHLYKLKSTIEMAGVQVIIFSPDHELFSETKENSIKLESHSAHHLEIFEAKVSDGEFHLIQNDVHFDLIILNNDQSNPFDIDWKNFKTPILPSPYVGWYRRQKNHHFSWYKKIADEFSQVFGINPDLIQAKFTAVEGIDFNTKEGLDQLAHEVDQLLAQLPKESSVFVKASQGTYGMGISVVSSGEEIINMNRKVRNKMDIGKNKIKFTSILIQEGVETVLKCHDAPAEVTIYLVNGKSSGGFMRANPLKGTQANLNAQGMIYQKLCLSDIKQDCDHKIKEAVYSVIARLSTLAAAHDMKELMETI
jgi:glutamate--cysteine ligase